METEFIEVIKHLLMKAKVLVASGIYSKSDLTGALGTRNEVLYLCKIACQKGLGR